MIGIKKRGLGKNPLDELLTTTSAAEKISVENLRQLPIDVISSGKHQPRKDFNSTALQELADSIRAQGIIQPVVVRKTTQGKYEIVAGERRWRAAQLAGLSEIPVVIRDISDEAAMAMALIENIQREDLNPIEEAAALQRLIDEFHMTQEQVATVVGKARTTVTNLLRLLNLNADVKTYLINKQLEMGHAKTLLTLNGTEQSRAAKAIVEKKLSVRETEILISRLQKAPAAAQKKNQNVDVLRLQSNLSDKLGAAVTIHHSQNGKGKLIISYNSLDELDGILERIR